MCDEPRFVVAWRRAAVRGDAARQTEAHRTFSKRLGKYRKYLEFAGLLSLAVLIIWWFGRRLDWPQVKLAVQKSDWRLIMLAVAFVLLGYLWRALRWQAFLAPLAKASLREV